MFLDVYQQEATRLLGFLTRRVGPSDAPGVRDQSFVEFFVWLSAHPEHTNPTATLYMIAERRAIDDSKQRRREPPVAECDLDGLAGALALQYNDYRAADLRIDLRRALDSLSDRERRTVQLHHLEGMKVAECAALMGTGIDNVKRILKAALRKLRYCPAMTAYDVSAAARSQEVQK